MQPAVGTGDMLRDVSAGKLLLIGMFSGNPLTSCAGAAVLEYLRDHPEVYRHMEALASRSSARSTSSVGKRASTCA
jgi:glutamate-1-semialdehyde aminotransferase